MAREINLVPSVKEEMIKAIKLRNLILFICITVSIASIVVAAIFATIMFGQRGALDGKNNMINSLSSKLNSYSDLNEFLTIKDQLGDINSLTKDKKVLSRTFGILATLIPNSIDVVTVSELSVDLSEDQPTFNIEAQADARREGSTDYSVLESFKKSMKYMRYDYGSYVDKNGLTIPAYCIIESGQDGAIFKDSEKGIYAFWTIDAEGCNPSSDNKSSDYKTESYKGNTVVRIWRTPQFGDWYKDKKEEGKPYMSLDGQISGVEHFESSCITYTGNIAKDGSTPKWTNSNENCLLTVTPTSISNADITDGIRISDSSNGRNSYNELVVRFSATIYLAPEVYDFNNTHVITIPPEGFRNVTDSYLQIQNMFDERASDCEENDTECNAVNASEGEK